MRKQTIAKLTAALFGLACTAAWAEAPVQNMTVTGTIKAPICQIDIAGGEGDGTVNYGMLSTTLIKQGTAFNSLEKATLDWTITCDSDTYLTYTVEDNVSGSANTRGQAVDRVFGLGWVGDEQGKLGFFSMVAKGLTVDGESAYHGTKRTERYLDTRDRPYYNGANWFYYYSNYVHNTPGMIHGWGVSENNSSSALKAGRVFTMNMEVAPHLSGSTDIGDVITENISLNGSVTFTFAFGI